MNLKLARRIAIYRGARKSGQMAPTSASCTQPRAALGFTDSKPSCRSLGAVPALAVGIPRHERTHGSRRAVAGSRVIAASVAEGQLRIRAARLVLLAVVCARRYVRTACQ